MAIVRRISHSLLFIFAFFQTVRASVMNDPFPPEVADVIEGIMPAWPTYNLSIMIFVIMVGLVMGLLFYQLLSQVFTKEHAGEGGAKGIGVALAVVFTFMALRFMPFGYYLIIALGGVAVMVIYGLWVTFGGLTKFTGENKGITVAIIGVIILALAAVLFSAAGQMQSWGVDATSIPIIAGVVGILGGIITVLGTGSALSKGREGLGGLFGGKEGKEKAKQVNAARELQDLTRIRRIENKEADFLAQLILHVTDATRQVMGGSYAAAAKAVEDAITLLKKELKLMKKEKKTIQDALRTVHTMSEEERGERGIQEEHITNWEAGLARGEQYVEDLDALKTRIFNNVDKQLHRAVKILPGARGGDTTAQAEATTLLQTIHNELTNLQTRIQGRLKEVLPHIQQTAQAAYNAIGNTGPIPPGPAPVPGGAPPVRPI